MTELNNVAEMQLNDALLQKLRSITDNADNKDQHVKDEMTLFLENMASKYKTSLQEVYIEIERVMQVDAKQLSGDSRTALHKAQSALQRISFLSDDIGLYATISVSEPVFETVDLNVVVRNVLDALRIASSDGLLMLYTDKLPAVHGDKLLLSHLFTQLFNNSVKYKKKQSAVHVNYSRNIWNIGNSEQKEYHVISFKDNGLGCASPDVEMIFNTFFKSDAKNHTGSGLGLAICKKIMHKHGGIIQAFSQPNEGAVIQLCFPVF